MTSELTKAAENIVALEKLVSAISGRGHAVITREDFDLGVTLARHYLATHADGERVIDPLEAEQGRWQQAIYELVSSLSGSDTIDGAGCDSGDPLDLSLTEIHQAWNVRENADFDREQEGKEPITEEWLREIGFKVVSRWPHSVTAKEHPLFQHRCGVAFIPETGEWTFGNVLIKTQETRRQLLSLLSALGVEAKGAK